MVDVIDSGADKTKEGERPFFVVSPVKFGVMTFFTMGWYWVYCFYQSWKLHRASTGEPVSPFWRSVFAIFFVYPLMKRVDKRIRDSGKTFPWHILGLTLSYYGLGVAWVVISVLLDGELWAVYAAGFVFRLVWLMLLVTIQNGINFSAGDRGGERNSRFTVANWLWILLFAAVEVAQFFALLELASMM